MTDSSILSLAITESSNLISKAVVEGWSFRAKALTLQVCINKGVMRCGGKGNMNIQYTIIYTRQGLDKYCG